MAGGHVTERQRETALHHANLIQQRKEVQQNVVEAQEELLDFPRGDHPNVNKPSASDVARFSELIQPFHPDDFDDLFTERKCADRCAYIFCPKPSPPVSKNRGILDWSRSKELGKVVKRDDRWCSKECVVRAMYIKVQLSETPAWERLAQAKVDIKLLTDDDDDILTRMSNLGVKDNETKPTLKQSDKIEDLLKTLSIERGKDKAAAPGASVMNTDLKERQVTGTPPRAPAPTFDDSMDIEGYVPKIGSAKAKPKDAEDEEEDEDWVL